MNAPTPPAATPGRARQLAMAAASVLLVLALGAAVAGGVMWARAASAQDDVATLPGNQFVAVDRGAAAEPTAAARQVFLTDSAQAAAMLTTVRPADTDTMIANLKAVSTGTLADELVDQESLDALVQSIAGNEVTMTPHVVSVTPTQFDPAAGTGQALVMIMQNLSWAEGDVERRQGIALNMELGDDGVWRAASIVQLFEGVGAVAGADGATPQNSGPGAGSAPAPENPAGS